jgi:ParB-like chromosome segregation protein Spo0J
MRIHDLEVQMVRLENVSQHPDNANDGDVDALTESIDINGFYDPIKVQRSTGFIVAGNHRYLVALSRGVPALPVIYLDIDDEQAKRILLADNAVTRKGHDNEAQLLNVLGDLYATDLALHGTGYDLDDFEKLQADINGPLKFDETDIPTIIEPATPAISGGMRVAVNPIWDANGQIGEISILKHDFGAFTRADVNAIRKALGLNPYSKADFEAGERDSGR